MNDAAVYEKGIEPECASKLAPRFLSLFRLLRNPAGQALRLPLRVVPADYADHVECKHYPSHVDKHPETDKKKGLIPRDELARAFGFSLFRIACRNIHADQRLVFGKRNPPLPFGR